MSIDDTLLKHLRLCSQCLHHQYRDSGSRYRILALLLDREKISQQELKDILDVKSGSISELLTKLEKKGLIRRKKNDADKRNRDIVLTEAGRTWIQDHEDPKRQCAGQLFSELSAEEKSQLAGLLGKMLKTNTQIQSAVSETTYEDGPGTDASIPGNDETVSDGTNQGDYDDGKAPIVE